MADGRGWRLTPSRRSCRCSGFAALWSAARLLKGQASWLPLSPDHDATGLAIEIVG